MSTNGLMKRMLICAVALAAAGCVSRLNIINPSYSLRSVQGRVNLGLPPSIDLELALGVDNPNDRELRLDRLDFDLFINGDRVLHDVRSDQGIRIPARGYGEVQLTAHVTYHDIEAIFRNVAGMVEGNRASYAIRGNAYYGTPIGTLRFPISVNFR